jgi:uncharacterized membrane protein YeaQ/YmgE (transglycosylase-associated protein family)
MIYAIIIGAIAGWLASMIVGKDAEMGAIANIIVGIVGGAIGSFIFRLIGFTASNIIGQIIVGVVGAVILLSIINAIQNKN